MSTRHSDSQSSLRQSEDSDLPPDQELEKMRLDLGRSLIERDKKNRWWAWVEKAGKTLMKRARRGWRLGD